MLTKTQRKRLEQVCLVLFPKYKRVIVNNLTRGVTLYMSKVPILRRFLPKWKISLTELIHYQIPHQLADFKYGNHTFISIVQEDLVRCDMIERDPIDYFLDEIRKVKYADVYKGFGTLPEPVGTLECTEDDDELYDEMVNYHQRKEMKKNPFSYHTTSNRLMNWFYVLLFLLTAFVILSHTKL